MFFNTKSKKTYSSPIVNWWVQRIFYKWIDNKLVFSPCRRWWTYPGPCLCQKWSLIRQQIPEAQKQWASKPDVYENRK